MPSTPLLNPLYLAAPFTTDADLALDPAALAGEPQLVAAMQAAGFSLKIRRGDGGVEPGTWVRAVEIDGEQRVIPVDLIIPGALAPGHRRRSPRSVTRFTIGSTKAFPGAAASDRRTREMWSA